LFIHSVWKICTYLFETLFLKNLLKEKTICKIIEKLADTLALNMKEN